MNNKLLPIDFVDSMTNYMMFEKGSSISWRVVKVSDIRAMLSAAPDVAGEPVAWIYSFIHSSALGYGDEIIGPVTTLDREKAYKVGHINIRQLYTTPQPDRTAELEEIQRVLNLRLQDCDNRNNAAIVLIGELEDKVKRLVEAITLTIEENLYLADGENCTLHRLNTVITEIGGEV